MKSFARLDRVTIDEARGAGLFMDRHSGRINLFTQS
jgi:hypothetical protein